MGQYLDERLCRNWLEARDSNTPHIKRVWVVSTVEYYLSD